jgi:hypothetical protein
LELLSLLTAAILAMGPARVASKVDRPSYFQTPVTLAKAQKNENEVAGTMAIIAEGADIRR